MSWDEDDVRAFNRAQWRAARQDRAAFWIVTLALWGAAAALFCAVVL